MKLKEYIRWDNIGIWILVFFLIRLIGITNPPLEASHSWRQCTGLMVARNFVETHNSIFYPEVNETNGGLGYVGMEFPSLYYAHALVASIVGYDHWYGRLINLIVSSIGIWFFYKLVKKYFTEQLAFRASLLLLGSIWFAFSRKTMSDTFCIALVMMALWYGLKYLEEGKWKDVTLYWVLALLGVLSKIPAVIYLVILAIPFFQNRKITRSKIVLFLSSVTVVAATYAWYFVWNHHLAQLSGKWYNLGNNFSQGLQELSSHAQRVWKHFYFDAFYGYLGFVLFLLGLFFMIKKGDKKLLYITVLTFGMFALYAIKSGQYFQHHDYYIIPIVPVMALIAATGLELFVQRRVVIALLVFAVMEGIANQQHDFFIKEDQRYKLSLASVIDQFANASDLIAINGAGDPQLIYFSHRKGWSFDQALASKPDFWFEYKKMGAKWIVFDRHLFEVNLGFPVQYESDDFLIYRLHDH